MATAQDLIERSMRMLGILGSGVSATSQERTDALALLNELIESWNNEGLMIYEESREEYTLTPSLNPHTIGSGGTFNTTRPLRILDASYIAQDYEFPIRVLTKEEWQTIPDKTSTSSRPSALWYEAEYPLGKIWLYPVPAAADKLALYLWKQLDAALTLGTSLSLPPGYLRALRFNLAVELAPEFGVATPEWVAAIARESKAAIKAQNIKPQAMEIDPMMGALAFQEGSTAGGRLRFIRGDL